MFYTSVDQVYDRIFWSYIDNNGKQQYRVVSEFPIDLYVKSNKQDAVGLFGESLGRLDFSSLKDAMDFMKENKHQEIFGQTKLLYQFISNQFKKEIEFDFSKIKVMFYDIETAFDEEFPDPNKATDEILSISVKVLNNEHNVVFGTKEYTGTEKLAYIKCTDEKDLLIKFQKFWRRVSPNIISGWNIDGFDTTYLINRSINVFDEDFANKFSPFYKNTKRCISQKKNAISKDTETEILGIISLDYLKLYKKFSGVTLESYRLDVVTKHELNEGKVDYKEYGNLMDFYNKNYNLFIEYNLRDALLIERLEKKLNFILLVATVAYLGKCRYQDVFHQVSFWDVHIYNFLKERNIQIPPKKDREEEEIVGAYVKEPKPGLYSWIVTLDLTSLYPSIIMGWNLSPETICSPAKYTISDLENFISLKQDTGSIINDNHTMLANGSEFTKETHGIFPQLVEYMFASRKKFKGQMLDAEKKMELVRATATPDEILKLQSEISTYNAKQNAFKVSLNSLYGASGNRYFRYYNKDIAEGITMTGQLIIQFIALKINEFLNNKLQTQDIDYCTFSDTDSVGLNLETLIKQTYLDKVPETVQVIDYLDEFVKQHINPILETEFSKLTEYLNVYKNTLSMKREIIADKGMWRGKKHYILQVWDSEGVRYAKPKLKIKGIEVVKSSTPQIVRDALKDCLAIILNKNEKTLQEYVTAFKKKFYESNISEVSFPRGVSDMEKWISASGELLSGVPIHTRGSILYNQLIKNHKHIPRIKNGDKIKFVYLDKKNPTRSHVISFLDELPEEFNLHQYIDWDTQYQKAFYEPMKSFTDITKWSVEKRKQLNF